MLTKEEMQYKIDYEIIVDCYDEPGLSNGFFALHETFLFNNGLSPEECYPFLRQNKRHRMR